MDSQRGTTLPTEVDVAVIGGGMTGCSAALHVAMSGKTCVLLETRGVGWGASGHNGGHLWPAQSDENSRRAFEARSTKQLQDLCAASGEDCAIDFPGSVELASSAAEMRMMESGAGEAWSAGRVAREYGSAEGRFAGGHVPRGRGAGGPGGGNARHRPRGRAGGSRNPHLLDSRGRRGCGRSCGRFRSWGRR